MTRNIKKSLAGVEDLAIGLGTVQQERGVLHRVNVFPSSYSYIDMQRYEGDFFRLYGSDAFYTDYHRNPAGTVGIPADAGGVWEPLLSNDKSVGGNSTNGAYLVDNSYVLWHADTASYYGWTGLFPHVAVPGSDPAAVGSGYALRTDIVFRAEITPSVFASLRRSYAEAGLTLVDGSFEDGGTLTNATDVLLHKASGKAYSWGGEYPGGGYVVAEGSSPVPESATEWIDKSAYAFSPISFPVVASVVSIDFKDGTIFKTSGYDNVFDNGGATYIVNNSLTPDGFGIIQVGSGAAINISSALTLEMFGADPTDTAECSSAINYAFQFAKTHKKAFRQDYDSCYRISSGVVIPAPVTFIGKPTEGELKTGTVFHWVGDSDVADAVFCEPSSNYKDNMREVANIAVYTNNTNPAGSPINGKCRSLFRYDAGHGTYRNIRTTSNNLAEPIGMPPALIGIWGYKAYSFDFTGHNYAHGCGIGFLCNDIDITSANISTMYLQNNIACFVAFAPCGLSVGALSAEGSNVRWRVVAGNHRDVFMSGLTIAGLYGYGNAVNIQKGIYIRRDITACLQDVNSQVSGRLQTALANAGSTTSFTPNSAIPSCITINGLVQGDVDVEDVIRYVPNIFQVSGGSVLNIPTLNELLSYSNNGTITPKFSGVSPDYKVKVAGANNGFLEKRIALSAAAGEVVLGTFSLSATNSKQVQIYGELLMQSSFGAQSLPLRFSAGLTTPGGVVTVGLAGETGSNIKIRVQGGADVITAAGTTAAGSTNVVYEVYMPSSSLAISGVITGFMPTTSAACSLLGTSVR